MDSINSDRLLINDKKLLVDQPYRWHLSPMREVNLRRPPPSSLCLLELQRLQFPGLLEAYY